MKKTFTIIFMGTPEFGVPSLKALHAGGHTIALVVTRPDRPKGRGRKVLPPPVKTQALDLGLDTIQPKSLKTREFEDHIRSLKPDFLIVAAFGHILTQSILSLPRIGTINVHASLLPKYRGPAPINWAIINGENETGVTTMLMDKGLDTGDILLTAKESITPEDTAATLHDRLAVIGADLLAILHQVVSFWGKRNFDHRGLSTRQFQRAKFDRYGPPGLNYGYFRGLYPAQPQFGPAG